LRIEDAAVKTVFNANQQVDPALDYTYDPIYRLIETMGREHVGQSAFASTAPSNNYRDFPFVGAAQQGDLQALRNYKEHYDYDQIGNFERMVHQATNGSWTRTYTYNEPSLIEPTKRSNRLSQTAVQTNGNPLAERYLYDTHGNITQMPHLPTMQWNFGEELQATSRQMVNAGAPEMTYYVYGASGQRVRKITERPNGSRKNERVYLGSFETYSEFSVDVALERQTLQVMDNKQRIAIVDTQTVDNGASVAAPLPTPRYQLNNHLGSVSLEIDEVGGLISYEEYGSYGSAAFQAGRTAAEVSLKLYRYTGKERDEENGLSYHGARYYAPWFGRWTSVDPAGLADSSNLYLYVKGNPVRHFDPTGGG